MNMSQDFYRYLCQKYPKLQDEALENDMAANLLSPFQVHLPVGLKTEVLQTIEAFQKLRESPAYQSWIEKKWGSQFNPGNHSLFMSYDFHVTPEKELKLIEINTNASFLGLGWEMFQFLNIPWNADFQLPDLKSCLLQEMQLASYSQPLSKIVITDEAPSQQKLYLEFVYFREFFKTLGFDCEIADVRDKDKLQSAQLIYNRTTDFYLEEEPNQFLKDLYQNRSAVLSPNPYEYRLLADKENFVAWSDSSFWEQVPLEISVRNQINKVLLKTQYLTEENKDDIWSQRKQLFFKPKRAFGSKSAYKGASISRKVFDDLLKNQCLAQEWVAAPEVEFETEKGKESFKYDLRCYAYGSQFQGCVARLYQGQVTNLRTENGGFAAVLFQN